MTPGQAKELFIEHEKARHLAHPTITAFTLYLDRFCEWCELNKITDLRDATEEAIPSFHRWMKEHTRPDGKPVSVKHINRHVRAILRLFKLLAQQHYIMTDIGKFYPKLHDPKTLPRGIMTQKQMMLMLRQPNLSTPLGFRDRTILETLYSTALRAGELCRLTIYDLDLQKRTVRVIQGKGKKDRVVPIGKTAASYVDEYIKTVRPVLLDQRVSAQLFIASTGLSLRTNELANIVKKYRDQAKLPDCITTHSLRHTCATEMLRGGASIRHVQELLGHADITTTQIYTHVIHDDLKRVHLRTAPSEQRRTVRQVHFNPENAPWTDSRNKKYWQDLKKRP